MAHEMEHAFSSEAIRKLEDFLEKCEICPHSEYETKPVCTLADLKAGDIGIVVRIMGKGQLRNRLLEMGIIKGTEIEITKFAPLGDPIEIKLRGYDLSIRKKEAALIKVRA